MLPAVTNSKEVSEGASGNHDWYDDGIVQQHVKQPPNQDNMVSNKIINDMGKDGEEIQKVPTGQEDLMDEEHGEENQGVETGGSEGEENPDAGENQGVDTDGTGNVGQAELEQTALEESMDRQYGARSGCYELQPWQQPGYASIPKTHLHLTQTENTTMHPTGRQQLCATAQVGMKKGLQMFGNLVWHPFGLR